MEKHIESIMNITENIKPEYLSKKRRKHPIMVIIEIHRDKKYGAIAKMFERNDIFSRIRETTTKKQREKFSKSLRKIKDDDKPVDTSKWVKPDEESIRNALIKSLFFLQIFKEDYWMWQEHFGKAHAFYSILHSHFPRNPQSLGNFSFGRIGGDYFETIMQEFKVPEGRKMWDRMTDKKGKYIGVREHRRWFKNWKKECLKNMIIPDKNPPIEKDIFKEIKKEAVTPMT